MMFSGFATGISDTSTSNRGTLISGNYISEGSTANEVGIDLGSSAGSYGNAKTLVGNTIHYAPGTAGVCGIRLGGFVPTYDVTGNSFDPVGPWSGTGTKKICTTSTAAALGFQQTVVANGAAQIPLLSRGALALFEEPTALTESSVASHALTLPSYASLWTFAPATATMINSFAGGNLDGRVLILRVANANGSFQNSALIRLSGGQAFTGPGTISFYLSYTGGASYAYEIARSPDQKPGVDASSGCLDGGDHLPCTLYDQPNISESTSQGGSYSTIYTTKVPGWYQISCYLYGTTASSTAVRLNQYVRATQIGQSAANEYLTSSAQIGVTTGGGNSDAVLFNLAASSPIQQTTMIASGSNTGGLWSRACAVIRIK